MRGMPLLGGGGESQREGVDRTVPGTAHHLPNLRFYPLPPAGPPSALGWAWGSEAAAGPGRMKTQKGLRKTKGKEKGEVNSLGGSGSSRD